MKLLVLIMLMLLTGCGTVTESVPDKAKTVTETEIGSFYTPILDTDENRVNNLILCARVLDGVEIESGKIFSFNDTVGARTQEKGYEEARILIGKEKGYAVGGGVCQISSTLYNAAKLAGMEILERHNHENEVHYVEIGDDAAVSYGELDFVFKNISPNRIRLDMSVENGYVYARIIRLDNLT
ncbi:MAG: VanW family protein [Clostridia bacterium]|nr:VanW family protein [Clostridia bacterium]